MKNNENKVDFDLSTLDFDELIKVYGDITDFLQFLEENKIVEKKVEDE